MGRLSLRVHSYPNGTGRWALAAATKRTVAMVMYFIVAIRATSNQHLQPQHWS